MRASAIIVHFHAPALAAKALSSFRADAHRQALPFEALIVDNGSTAAEREQLDALDAHVLDPAGNRSYAAGLNAGVAASTGDLLLLANADIEILPGCIAALRETLDAGMQAAGPRFYLDHARTWLQPPSDRRTLASELATICAQSGITTQAFRRRWRRRAHAFWSADTPMPMRQLSGALLAVGRETWERLGGFDEGYRLYFEETDWLMRLAAAGGRAGLAPAAHAVHLWGQSTRLEPRAATWFEQSAARFRRRWYGALGARFLAAAQRRLRSDRAQKRSEVRRAAASVPAAWIELAASRVGFPAAGHAMAGRREDPIPDLPAYLPARTFHLRGVSAAGKDIWCRDTATVQKVAGPLGSR